MSIRTIKAEVEQYLNTNVTTKAIKWSNTSVYTLNGVTLDAAAINALTEFLSPMIIPISEDRELYSTDKPFKYELFFQISIYTKINQGTGGLYDTVDLLTSLFKETNINDVVCDRTETLTSFQDDEHLITPVRIQCHLWAD